MDRYAFGSSRTFESSVGEFGDLQRAFARDFQSIFLKYGVDEVHIAIGCGGWQIGVDRLAVTVDMTEFALPVQERSFRTVDSEIFAKGQGSAAD